MKKLMAMLTAVIITVSTALPLSAFAAFSDVNDSNPYKGAITTLTTLSVIDGYEDGTFRPDGAITRAEFTKLIVYMLGFQNLKYQTYSFGDIESGFWASDFVQTACDRGIVAGFEDGTFRPNDSVTYAQVLKMVVCTLGYEEFAMNLDIEARAWADKYIQEAGQLGLTKNVTAAAGYYENATRGMVAQVLYNALEVEMCENNGYNWVKTDKTLMHDYLKVTKLKGTLVGVEDHVTEDCTKKLLEEQMDVLTSSGDEVLLNFSLYTNNVSDLTKLLGSDVTLYYRELSTSDDYMLINIDVENTKNTVTELNYDDIVSISGSTLKYYDESGKTRTTKLRTDSFTVRYNGKNVAAGDTVEIGDNTYTRQEALEEWLTPDTDNSIYGTVTLTDNGSDGTVDMVQIYDYDIIVAYATPNSSDYRITDKLVTGNYLILDPESSEYTYTITKNGTEIPVTSISTNDVVLYAKSLDGERYTLLVTDTSKPVEGTISSIDAKKTKMTISGTSYNIGSTCESYIREKSNKELKAGASGTFYTDALGTIIYGTLKETATSPYAYITDAFIDYDEGGRSCITVYIPTVNASTAVTYPLKSSVKLNGASTKAEAALGKIQAAAEYAGNESAYAEKIYGAGKTPQNTKYAQPARITVSNGTVTDIVILTTDELMPQNEDKESIFKCKELNAYTYSSNSFTQDGKSAFSVNSSTIVIYVPRDRSVKGSYSRKTVASAFTSGDSYYVEAYDLNSSKIAGLLILYENNGTLTQIKKDTNFSVVGSEPIKAYSEAQDDTVLSLDMFTGINTPRTWLTYDSEEFKDVKVGDVIQFAYDSDNLAQGLVTNISFDDIAGILDGKEVDGQKYNWSEEITPGEDNNYQSYKFDYRFKKNGTTEDETYTSSTLGTIPYSRAAMFNVSQVLLDENKLYVTNSGFIQTGDEDGSYVFDDDSYEEVTISSSTKFLRMEDERDELSKYAAGTTTELTINDIKDIKNYGTSCSKILVCFSKGVAKLIVLYN